MTQRIGFIGISAVALYAVSQSASAHISYTNVLAPDSRYAPFFTVVDKGDGSKTYNFLGSVRGNYAWADAADEDWGDSHWILPWNMFEISNPGGAKVSISVSGGVQGYEWEWNEELGDIVPFTAGLEDLNPAFTLYRGLLPEHAHDASYLLPPDEGKEGRWNALGDVSMAVDSGEIGTVHYLDHAGEAGGTATTVALHDLLLPAGFYSLTIGGACSACKLPTLTDEIFNTPELWDAYVAQENDNQIPRGYTLSVTVRPVPVPAAVWLMGSSLAGLIAFGRRHRSH